MTDNNEDTGEIEPFGGKPYANATFGGIGSGSTFSTMTETRDYIMECPTCETRVEVEQQRQEPTVTCNCLAQDTSTEGRMTEMDCVLSTPYTTSLDERLRP